MRASADSLVRRSSRSVTGRSTSGAICSTHARVCWDCSLSLTVAMEREAHDELIGSPLVADAAEGLRVLRGLCRGAASAGA